MISSVRSELPVAGLSAEEYATDQNSGLARRYAPDEFSWEVARVAQEPEFGTGADLSFNRNTGAIQIGVRRGSSKSGLRNFEEALTLTVRDIPQGYILAERVKGEYRAVGATDAFKTMTLFTLPRSVECQRAGPGAFTRINSNLFLVSDGSSKDPKPEEPDAKPLSLTLTAHISGQPGGDSRSTGVTRQLSLGKLRPSEIPQLSKTKQVVPPIQGLGSSRLALSTLDQVDPLILDLGGTGLKGSLTNLEQSLALDEDVSFAMLPQRTPHGVDQCGGQSRHSTHRWDAGPQRQQQRWRQR